MKTNIKSNSSLTPRWDGVNIDTFDLILAQLVIFQQDCEAAQVDQNFCLGLKAAIDIIQSTQVSEMLNQSFGTNREFIKK